MRKSLLAATLMIVAAAMFVLPDVTTGQFQMGGKGKGKSGMGGGIDPGVVFDYLAKGRNHFLISESPRLRDQLTQFAQERGITNSQITRQQYLDFDAWRKTKLTQSAPGGSPTPGGMQIPGGGPGGKGDGGGFDRKKGFGGGGGGPPKGATLDPEVVRDFADREFKRADGNGDSKLTKDEMPSSLLASLSRWDKNGDHFIDQNEFRDYYAARIQGDDGNANRGIATIVIEDDELDRKPIVYRASNLPRNLPSWFKDLDTDTDGQVALCEWRAGKKPLEEFVVWDLNDDGYIIPEEALRTQEVLAKNTTRPGSGDTASMSKGGGFGRKGGGGGGGGGENPFGGGFGRKGSGGGDNPFGGGFGKKGGGNGENPYGGFGGKKGKKGGGN